MNKSKLFAIFLLLFFLASAGLVSADVTRSATQYQYNNNLTDMGYNGFDASFAGSGGTYVSGKINDAFDNEGTACSVASSETLNATGNHDLTVAFWIYLPVGASNGEFLYEVGTTGTGSYFAEIDVNENIGTYIGSGGGYVTSGSVSLTTWTHYLTTYHATNRTTCVYLDGVLDGCNAHSKDLNHPTGPNSDFVIGGLNAACGNIVDAYFDDWRYYEEALNGSQIAEIYNSGTGTEDNPIGGSPPSPDNLTITITDLWNGSNVNNVTASILGNTFTNTTGHIVYTNVSVNASVITEINITGQDYFSSRSDYNLSSAIATTLFQAQIQFNATELYTNNSISNVTFTVNANTDNPKYMSAGSYTVTASHPSYFDKVQEFNVSALENITITVTGMSDTILNITAIDGFTGQAVGNFTITANNSLFTVSESTTNTFVQLSILQGYNYTVNFTHPDYVESVVTLEVDNSIENYTFIVYKAISFRTNFFDEETLQEINNVTFDVLGNTFSNSFDTGSNNYLLIEDLPEGVYEIRYTKENYTERSYHMIIPHTEDNAANISLYLIEEDESQLFIRTITDQGNNPLTSYYLQVQRPYPSDDNTSLIYRTVEIASIDNQGEAVFSAKPNTQQYRFRILDENLALINTLTPSFLVDTASSIIGTVTTSNMENFNIFTTIVSDVVYQNATTSFVLDYTAPTTVTQVCLVVINTSGLISSEQETCSTDSSSTITIVVDPSLNTTYVASGYAYINGDVFLIAEDSEDFSFSDSREIVRYIGAFLYFLLMLLCIGMGAFTNPIPAVALAVFGTAAFGLGFLGLFTVATYLTGGLLVLGIIILLLLRGRS